MIRYHILHQTDSHTLICYDDYNNRLIVQELVTVVKNQRVMKMVVQQGSRNAEKPLFLESEREALINSLLVKFFYVIVINYLQFAVYLNDNISIFCECFDYTYLVKGVDDYILSENQSLKIV